MMTNLGVPDPRATEMKATTTTITTEKGGGAVEVGRGIVKETKSGKERKENEAGVGNERIRSKYSFRRTVNLSLILTCGL
jgi:hypothetical protein